MTFGLTAVAMVEVENDVPLVCRTGDHTSMREGVILNVQHNFVEHEGLVRVAEEESV